MRLDQRGLTGAVAADQCHPLAALDGEVGPLDQPAAGHVDVHPLDLDHRPAGARGGWELEAQRSLLGGLLDPLPLDPRHRLQLALGLSRLGAIAEAVDEPLEVGELLLLALELVGLHGQALGALPPPVRVAALGQPALAAVELEHRGGDRLQEPAVVADEHDRGVQPVQVLLEPLDGVDVEVVGGLVEQQHVGLAGQRPGQRGAGQLTAREGVQRPFQVIGCEAQAAGDRLQLRPPAVTARLLELRRRPVVAAHGGRRGVTGGHAGLERAQLVLQTGRLGGTLADVLAQRDAAGQRRPLVVQRHPGARRQLQRAGVGGQLAGQDPQQRGLAGAVSAHQGHPVARPHDRRDVSQHLVAAVGELQLGHVERHQRTRRTTLPNRSGCSRRAWAAAASASGKLLSTTGRQSARSTWASSASSSRGLPIVVPSRFHCP